MSVINAIADAVRQSHRCRQAVAFLLVFTMLFSAVPTSAYAVDVTEAATERTVAEETTAPEVTEADALTEPVSNDEVIEATEAPAEEPVEETLPEREIELAATGEIVSEGTWQNGNNGINGSGTWTLDSDGVLNVEGTGILPHKDKCPWKGSTVKKVVFGNGITGTDITFEDMTSLEVVDLSQCADTLTMLGDYVFNRTGVKTVIGLENLTNLTSIGFRAFKESQLTGELDLSNLKNLTSIGEDAFRSTNVSKVNLEGCENLTSIGGWAFAWCKSLTEVKLPDSVSSIGKYAFENCDNLKSANLPQALLNIPEGLFNNDKLLAELAIPDGYWKSVETIGFRAFKDCQTLPLVVDFSGNEVLKSIGADAFRSCAKLIGIADFSNIASTETRPTLTIGDHAFANSGLSEVRFTDCTALKNLESYTFENIKAAGSSSYTLKAIDFSGCTNLVSIGEGVFKNSIITTADFSDCTSLETVGPYIFNDNTRLEILDFSGCTSLKELKNYVITKGGRGSVQLIDLTGCDNLEIIGDNAFDGFTNAEIRLPDLSNLTSIGALAFYNDKKLTSIDLSGTDITAIKDRAFYGCTSLESVDLSECTSLKSIDSQAFEGDYSLRLIDLGGCVNLETIGANAFNGCRSLYEVNLRNCGELTTIGAKAFQNCSSIEEMVIPEKVTSISSDSFVGCKGIQVLEWRATDYTENLDKDTFSAMSNYDLHIGEDVNSLPGGFFRAVKNAGEIYFDAVEGGHVIHIAGESVTVGGNELFSTVKNDIYVDSQGVVYELFDDGTARLVYCPPGISDYTVPVEITADGTKYDVTAIAPSAFTKAKDLTVVHFEDANHIKQIGENAFYGLINLAKVIDDARDSTAKTTQQARHLFNSTTTTVPSSAFRRTALEDDDSHVWSKGVEKGELKLDNGTATVEIGAPTSGYLLNVTTYEYMTGSYFNVPVKIQTTDAGGCVVQIFVDFSNSGYNGFDSEIVITDSNNHVIAKATPADTDDPDIKCLQFKLEGGATAMTDLRVTYPTPTSPGGEVRLWVNIPTEEATGTIKAVMDDPRVKGGNEYMHARWTTERRERDPRKVALSSRVSIRGSGDTETPDLFYVDGSTWRLFLDYATDKQNANIGQDFVTSVLYSDVLKLPEGIQWDDKILNAIKTGEYTFKNIKQSNDRRQCYLVVEGEQVMYLEFPASASARRINFTVDDDNNLLVTWELKNPSTTADLTNDPIIFGVLNNALIMKLSEVTVTDEKTGEKHQATEEDFPLSFKIQNELGTRVSYTHSAISDWKQSVATMTAVADKANLVIEKSQNGPEKQYLGDDVTFHLTASNTGAQSTTGLNVIEDTLADGVIRLLYLKPENMEKMFGEEFGNRLTITISNANLYQWNSPEAKTATSSLNGSVDLTALNSGELVRIKEDQKLIITKTDDGYQLVCGDQTYKGSSIEKLLSDIGYYVDADCEYTVHWGFTNSSDIFTMVGGRVIDLPVYATHKDTFALLTQDAPIRYRYPSEWHQPINNRVDMYYTEKNDLHEDVEKVRRASIDSYDVYPEIEISKSLNTKAPENNFQNDQLLNYTVTVTESGLAGKTELPVTDRARGAQMIAVRADKNPDMAGQSLELYEGRYYLLKEGVYHNIYLGTDQLGRDCIADTVTVTKSVNNEGCVEYDTNIAWYLETIAGNDVKSFTYYTVVRALDEYGAICKSYSFDNIAYANDRKDDRLFATIGGGGSTYGVTKKIVTAHGDQQHKGEQFDEDDFTSLSSSNRTVTYKLTLSYDPENPDWSVSFTGKELFDRLPQTFGVFAWTKGSAERTGQAGNVSLEVVTKDGAVVSDGFAENWSVAAQNEKNVYGTADGQYYIVWDNAESVTLTGKSELDIYVTLTFANEEEWSVYADASEGRTLTNLWYVDDKEAIVTHDIRDRNKAYLQKGVNKVYQIGLTDSRTEYGNIQGHVEYYIMLYNGGNSRLYLSDLIDTLPKGFTFLRMDNTTGHYSPGVPTNKTCTTMTDISAKQSRDCPAEIVDGTRDVTFVSLQLTALTTDDNHIRFVFDGAKQGANYDEDYDLFFLAPGQALMFDYLVDVDENVANTDSTAVNRVVTEFADPMGLGVEKYTFPKGGSIHGAKGNGSAYNDGSCLPYGGSSGLQSLVTLTRGEPVPGVKKRVVSYTYDNKTESIKNGDIVKGAQKINWEITVKDAGYNDIMGYSITDTMQYPYRFSGEVWYRIYDKNGSLVDRVYESAGTFERPIFTIVNYTTVAGGDTYVILEDVMGDRYQVKVAKSGDDPVPQTLTIPYLREDYGNVHTIYRAPDDQLDFQVSFGFEQDENTGKENMRMTVTFADEVMQLLPYCSGVMTLETSTNIEVSNTEMYNNVIFAPENKNYRTIDDGKRLYDDKGENAGVYAEANISLSSGGGTSSVKAVTEDLHPENTTDSDRTDDNTITLADKNNTFTYTLSVTNATGGALDRLVIADHLPAVNDMFSLRNTVPRGSEFKVWFTENEEITVTIDCAKSRESYVIPAEHYKVQYSENIWFNDDDMTNFDAENWDNTLDPSRHRSIRFLFDESNYHEIHEDDTIHVTFRARADKAAEQGQTAYNGFVYWYKNNNLEMHASSKLVGVQVPNFPSLQKKTVNLFGFEAPATEAKDFYFLAYEGAKIADMPVQPLELDANGVPLTEEDGSPKLSNEAKELIGERHYKAVKVHLKKGEILSEAVNLYTHEMWQSGGLYTIEEILLDDEYDVEEWQFISDELEQSSTDRTVTFRYDNSKTQTVVGVNSYREWSFRIHKVSSFNQNALPGAVFALYSTNARDKIDESSLTGDQFRYDDNTLVPAEITFEKQQWYLKDVKASGQNGDILWADLREEQYAYIEVKAPDGFFLPTDGYKIVLNTDLDDIYATVATKEIENRYGYLIPGSGGEGGNPFAAAGGVLTLTAIVGLTYRYRKKRKLFT